MSSSSPLRVLALAPYPETGPSTRFRLSQFVEPLADQNVLMQIRPFLSESEYEKRYEERGLLWKSLVTVRGFRRRIRDLTDAGEYDVVIVHRELAPIGNGMLRAELVRRRIPYIFDFDDAVFLSAPGSDRFLSYFRRPRSTTASLCRDAHTVWAGNEYLGDFARAATESADARVEIVPTVIDAQRFCPSPDGGEGGKDRTPADPLDESETAGRTLPRHESDVSPVIGWIGTHTTLPNLEALFPALRELADRTDFRLRVVSNRSPSSVPDEIRYEFWPWRAEHEVKQTRSLDVGLYPLEQTAWNQGKCGFKAIQYLACGVPVVASPVGVIRSIVVPEKTGLWARTPDEWIDALETLVREPSRRRAMGQRGRDHVEEGYSVSSVLGTITDLLREAATAEARERTSSR